MAVPPSCETPLTCGSVSCCLSLLVPGGKFPMGRSLNGSDAYPAGGAEELPEHDAAVADFHLDTFEVTVGRFRAFVNKFSGAPLAGAGAHPLINGSGWKSAWDSILPATKSDLVDGLTCDASATWTDVASSHENLPINCVSWYEAFAFCAWDKGRLPTEAEWECAAAGGEENRLYPWGKANPSAALAVSNGPSISTVGSVPDGNGRWGHSDLSGNLWEWNIDVLDSGWYAAVGGLCDNCANLGSGSMRVFRGGAFYAGDAAIRAATRGGGDVPPDHHHHGVGFRCAR
jgi:formylglycine-generating enzyme required for sulfatase activity